MAVLGLVFLVEVEEELLFLVLLRLLLLPDVEGADAREEEADADCLCVLPESDAAGVFVAGWLWELPESDADAEALSVTGVVAPLSDVAGVLPESDADAGAVALPDCSVLPDGGTGRPSSADRSGVAGASGVCGFWLTGTAAVCGSCVGRGGRDAPECWMR